MLPTTPIEDYLRKKEKLLQKVRDQQALLTQLELEIGLRISPFMEPQALQRDLDLWKQCQTLQVIARHTMEILGNNQHQPPETQERVDMVIRREV